MTNSPPSSSEPTSSNFQLLHERIQHWIWQQGWTTLRDAQEAAIPILLAGERDVIISAATAEGKTEAAFLPILSRLLNAPSPTSTVLYVSPLKALINDQWGRLTGLCEDLDIHVTPWHGDISATKKTNFLKRPRGIVLITPESLEALFVLRGHQIGGIFRELTYVIIDELHSFIDPERGKQLQSQLCRLQAFLPRRVPRVGLSATLGDMRLAAEFLRPEQPDIVDVIVSASGQQSLKIWLRAVEDIPPLVAEEDTPSSGALGVAEMLYEALRGCNNLVFPNSRANVEKYCDLLSRRCELEGVPNEFWAHHGSLSKDQREQTEAALKRGEHFATAICTSTMEMGIDIGSVKNVAQVGPPPSVASLRQRLGRSGRRAGEVAILRSFQIIEPLSEGKNVMDGLRQDLLHSIACIQLLLQKWCEPPRPQALHASTFVQQLLSVIAERGGVTAATLWTILVERGAFRTMPRPHFVSILRELGKREIIMQESSGLLLHGTLGEKIVNHYTFYAAFTSEDEYRVTWDGRVIGQLSVSNLLLPDSRIILGGKRWRVTEVYTEEKVVLVQPDRGGTPPHFESGGSMVHNEVRQQMRVLAASDSALRFLDDTAQAALAAARRVYADARLDEVLTFPEGQSTLLFTWMGDWVNEALVLLYKQFGLDVANDGISLHVHAGPERTLEVLGQIADWDGEDAALFSGVELPAREKWDWVLPPEVLLDSYLSSALDVSGAREWAKWAREEQLIQRRDPAVDS